MLQKIYNKTKGFLIYFFHFFKANFIIENM